MIYLDNSATTKPYPEALDTFNIVSDKVFANPSSLHKLGGLSEEMLKKSRIQAAALLGINPNEVVFTTGGTEGNNLAIKGAAFSYRERGKHLITSVVEHASSYQAFKQLEQEGFDVTFLPVDKQGRISIDDFKKAYRKDTILVSLIHVNSEVGTVQPILEIGKFLKSRPTTVYHVDHVQGIGKVPFSIAESGLDMCTISGHKFHSPKGTGILFVRNGIKLSPLFSGGGQEFGRRAGTENLPGISAMVKALRMTLEASVDQLNELKALQNKILQNLKNDNRFIVHTPDHHAAPHIVNVAVKGIKAEVLVHALEEEDIYVSTKSACSSKDSAASKVLLAMGIPEVQAKQAIRISLSFQNSHEEIDMFLKILNEKISRLNRTRG